jgi:ATP-dependent helicase/nuclease subunit B
MTRASELLFISRPIADDEGRSTGPSSFWQRIIELFPDVTTVALPPGHDPRPAGIATPRQLVTSLMRWVRGSADPATATETAWPALYQWLASQPDDGSRIALMRARAWPALGYANDASLSPDVAGQMFSSPLEAGVSQMETFAACPFQHFARYGLGLRGRERQEVTAQDMGRLYHDLLEGSLKEVLQRRAAGDRTVTLESVLDNYISQIGGNIRHELMLGSARNRYLLERTRTTLQHIARAQREILKRGLFRPAHVGTTFGPGGKLPALRIETPSGGEVFLHGKIDRIDRVESTGDAAVIDYRLSSAKLPIGMVHHGLSLQLLSYLLVLESNGQKLSGRNLEPAAAFYLQLLRRIEDVKHPDESHDPDDPRWHLKLKPRGILDRRCLAALDKELEAGASDVVQAFITKDGNLGHRNTSDVAETEDFRSLLRFVSAKLGELADGIIGGRIDVLPYRLNDNSPCPRCDYRSVCRFDPAINKYNYLKVISREELVAEAGKGGG